MLTPIKRTVWILLIKQSHNIGGSTYQAVASYFDREEAERHMRLAQERMEQFQRGYSHDFYNPFDGRRGSMAYQGEDWTYALVECPFVSHVDEFIEVYTKE